MAADYINMVRTSASRKPCQPSNGTTISKAAAINRPMDSQRYMDRPPAFLAAR